MEKPSEREVKKRTGAYCVCVRDGKMLLVRPAWDDRWTLPGGGIEEGEEIEEGLKREFFEETGYTLVRVSDEPAKTAESNFYAEDIDEYFDQTLLFFEGDVSDEQDASVIDPKEIAEVAWLSPEELRPGTYNSVAKVFLEGGRS